MSLNFIFFCDSNLESWSVVLLLFLWQHSLIHQQFLWALSSWVFSLPRAVLTKSHISDGEKQQKCILSRYWKPEVWNQGVGRATLSLKALGEEPSLLILAAGGLWQYLAFPGLQTRHSSLCLCLHTASPCASLCLHIISYKCNSHWFYYPS